MPFLRFCVDSPQRLSPTLRIELGILDITAIDVNKDLLSGQRGVVGSVVGNWQLEAGLFTTEEGHTEPSMFILACYGEGTTAHNKFCFTNVCALSVDISSSAPVGSNCSLANTLSLE